MAKVVFLLLVFLMSYNVEATDQPRCLKSIQKIEQELSSNVPPIEEWYTNNYNNISRALFPGFKLPALYIKVTIQFLNDTGNQTAKTISDEKPKKFTWSESCRYVSTRKNWIDLTTMSLYSLGTIWPQRRQTELVVTVHPLCEYASRNNSFKDDNEMWKFVLFTLQDIAIKPNISDPRVNTALCVVTGHEGDPEQGINYQTQLWFNLYKDPLPAYIIPVLSAYFTCIYAICFFNSWMQLEWTETVCHDPSKGTVRSILLIALVFTVFLTPITIAAVIKSEVTIAAVIKSQVTAYVILHSFWVVLFFSYDFYVPYISRFLTIVLGRQCFIGSRLNCNRCSSIIKWAYIAGRVCMVPCVYQIVHHLIWVFYGGVSANPSWAIPVFLCVCLVMFAPANAIYLYQTADEEVYDRKKVKSILIFSVVSLWFIIVVMMMSFYDHVVPVPTTSVVEIIVFAMLVWLVNKSGEQFFDLINTRPNPDPQQGEIGENGGSTNGNSQQGEIWENVSSTNGNSQQGEIWENGSNTNGNSQQGEIWENGSSTNGNSQQGEIWENGSSTNGNSLQLKER